jgi:hypothetical protein
MQKYHDAEQRKTFHELVQKTKPTKFLPKENLEVVAKILNDYHWKAMQKVK